MRHWAADRHEIQRPTRCYLGQSVHWVADRRESIEGLGAGLLQLSLTCDFAPFGCLDNKIIQVDNSDLSKIAHSLNTSFACRDDGRTTLCRSDEATVRTPNIVVKRAFCPLGGGEFIPKGGEWARLPNPALGWTRGAGHNWGINKELSFPRGVPPEDPADG